MKTFKATKKPVEVDVIHWDGSRQSTKKVLEFMGQKVDTSNKIACDMFDEYCTIVKETGLNIETLEDGFDGRAKHVASVGDYIIKGVKGEFHFLNFCIIPQTYFQEVG